MMNAQADNNSFLYVEYDELKSKIIDNIKELIVSHNKFVRSKVGGKDSIADKDIEAYLMLLPKDATKRLQQCFFLLAVINQCDNQMYSTEDMDSEKKTILNAATFYILSQIEKSYQKGVYGIASNWGFFNSAASSTLRTLLLDSLNLTGENPSPGINDKIKLYEELELFLRKHICLKDLSNRSEVSAFWKINQGHQEYDPLKELGRVSKCLQKEKERLLEETKVSTATERLLGETKVSVTTVTSGRAI